MSRPLTERTQELSDSKSKPNPPRSNGLLQKKELFQIAETRVEYSTTNVKESTSLLVFEGYIKFTRLSVGDQLSVRISCREMKGYLTLCIMEGAISQYFQILNIRLTTLVPDHVSFTSN